MTPSRALRAAAVLVAVTVGLIACAPARATAPGSSDGAGVIGVALPTTADAVWSRGADALSRELTARGYRVDLQFAASDARTQAAQVRNMLTKSVDAVIVAPLASGDLSTSVAAADETGVPVIAFGRSLEGFGVAGAIAFDPAALGRAQAQALLADLADAPTVEEVSPSPTPSPTTSDATGLVPIEEPGTARVAVLSASESDAWESARYEAAMAALQSAIEAGRIEIVSGATRDAALVDGDTAEGQAGAAEKRVRALREGALDEVPTAVLALGDAVTRGVVTALTTDPPEADGETASPTPSPAATDGGADAGPALAPLVVGSGADPLTVRALRDGDLDAAVFADPRALVSATADAVEAVLDDRDVPVEAADEVSPSILRADDVEELIASGWISADEL
ncbi:substrate-binding domain-containing protein [Microbacterium sp. KSW2-29]|uniref:Substrate-binding domain-containing protein n=1 Tax=Microbacterium phycohabitans TaxID=3075993 RepID=A0ABU3SP67_9MICO|nr:substrate-binding domain-containing protein [Microbacterium sp. KSW2-29]MDU0346644.1 substrate-binding domain-containing protein [Microbacterium sp. KSW2-29]